MLLGLCTWSSVCVTSRDAASAEFGQHGGGVDSQVLTNWGEGPAKTVQMDDVVDLLWGQAPATHRHVVTMKDLGDRAPLDTMALDLGSVRARRISRARMVTEDSRRYSSTRRR